MTIPLVKKKKLGSGHVGAFLPFYPELLKCYYVKETLALIEGYYCYFQLVFFL